MSIQCRIRRLVATREPAASAAAAFDVCTEVPSCPLIFARPAVFAGGAQHMGSCDDWRNRVRTGGWELSAPGREGNRSRREAAASEHGAELAGARGSDPAGRPRSRTDGSLDPRTGLRRREYE